MTPANTRLMRLIALFKLLKAVLLIVVGFAALKLIHVDIGRVVEEWVARTGLDPGSRYVGRLLLTAVSLTPTKIRDLAVGSFIYAALFLTEGIGLWLLKRWAEWFTVISTSSLVPVEVYEIFRHPSSAKILVLIINIAVVGYLVYQIRVGRHEPV